MAAGFWAGFGGELSSRIKERESFVREQTQRRQDYLRTVGVPAIQKRKAEMEADVGKIKSAVALGLKEDVANAAYQAGHLDIVMDDILKATDTTGAVNHFNSIQQFAEEVGKTAEDPFEVVKKVWGAVAETDADVGTEDGRNQSFFEAVFAWNPEAAIDQGVMKSSLKGYTEKDAAEALGGGVRRVTTPEGYRYESLPASISTGRAEFSQSDYRATKKSLFKSFGDSISTTMTETGDSYLVSSDVAPYLDGASTIATNTIIELMGKGASYQKAMDAVEVEKRKYLQAPASEGLDADWAGFEAAMAFLRGELDEAPEPILTDNNDNTDDSNDEVPSVDPFSNPQSSE